MSSFFPRSEIKQTFCRNSDNISSLPERPTTLGPIYDHARLREPLEAFETLKASGVYGNRSQLDSEASVPNRPNGFPDEYLYPALTQNEYVRLTMLWYHTRALDQDKELLQKLERILDLIRKSIGWEHAIIGILENDRFIRLTTSNMPLAILPRRESTCSHTVNMHPGTVFMIQDMSVDWRFQNSPHVAIGGLRSYAGTQLLLSIPNGEQVSLGSFCIASSRVQAPLTDDQKRQLIQAADMVAIELLSRTRLRRLHERQTMLNDLAQLRANIRDRDVVTATIQVLTDFYPETSIGVESIHDQSFGVAGTSLRIPRTSIQSGLWEDTAFVQANLQIDDALQAIDRPIRAVVADIAEKDQVLVVASKQLRLIFDDLDAWFVDQCARLINTALQQRLLREALAAKDVFLRSVTHQLRTPLHGILNSAEIMNEELAARNILQKEHVEPFPDDEVSLTTCLSAIRSSGTELMTAVNNILKFSILSSEAQKSKPTAYDLHNLEEDVLPDVLQGYPYEQIRGMSITFEYKLAEQSSIISIDADILKELLKCLVVNAIEATAPRGRITITTIVTVSEGSMSIDIVDTGVGILKADQDRIFLPFEKVDFHSRGAGLGLTLAAQMASLLGGSLALVSSRQGCGARFRLTLPRIEFLTGSLLFRQKSFGLGRIPTRYHIMQNSTRNLHLLEYMERYLQLRGLQRSNSPDDALIIMNQPNPFEGYERNLRRLSRKQLVIIVTDSSLDSSTRACFVEDLQPHTVWLICGPFYTSRLDDIMREASDAFDLHLSESNSSRKPVTAETSPKLSSAPLAMSPATPAAMLSTLTLPRPGASIRALLVDDNKVNLNVLEMYCKKRKFTYGRATDGNEATSSFCNKASKEDTPYTMILLDLQMPKCDGIEACKRIRAFEEENSMSRCVIFMITGQDSLADRTASFDAGADEYFVKPVSLKKLDQYIARYFHR